MSVDSTAMAPNDTQVPTEPPAQHLVPAPQAVVPMAAVSEPAASAQNAGNTYRVTINGVERGPYPLEHVRALVRNGELAGTDGVSYAGQAWVPAQNAPGIYSDKNYVTALLFSFFLGVFGIDRFYLGYTGMGVAKLLLGWLSLGIWPLIDFILIAMHKVPDAQGRPLR